MGVVDNLAPLYDANDLPTMPTICRFTRQQPPSIIFRKIWAPASLGCPEPHFRTGFLLKSIWSLLESRFDSREKQSRVRHKELEDKEMWTFFRCFFALLDKGQAWIVGTEDGK
ncbi:MAG: hypothetical protein WBQ43_23085 [Terriglobales bacterium]